jgi:hypothetical protein
MPTSLMMPILLLISSLALAQEKVIYDANVEKRTVGGFETIRVADGIDLYITQSAEEGVAVSATEIPYRDKIKTIVENGELKIYFDQGWMGWNWRNRKLKAYVAVKSLKGIKASGGSDVIVQGVLNCQELSMKLSGGSDFTGNVSITNFTIDQSGGSDVRIKGNVVNLRVEASGGSDFKGNELSAEYAIIEASGGSDAAVTVTKEIAAEANGGSDISYKGNPVIKYKSSSGGGNVSKRE